MTGTLVQLNVSRGGMPKEAVLQARVTKEGVEGDKQKNRKFHGGPDRAVACRTSLGARDDPQHFAPDEPAPEADGPPIRCEAPPVALVDRKGTGLG